MPYNGWGSRLAQGQEQAPMVALGEPVDVPNSPVNVGGGHTIVTEFSLPEHIGKHCPSMSVTA